MEDYSPVYGSPVQHVELLRPFSGFNVVVDQCECFSNLVHVTGGAAQCSCQRKTATGDKHHKG